VDHTTDAITPVQLFSLSKAATLAGDYTSLCQILLETSVVPWNKLISREYLARTGAQFDSIPFANDRTFHFKVVTQVKRVVLFGECLVNYRVNNPRSLAGNASTSRLKSTLQAFRNISELAKGLELDAQLSIFKKNMEDLVGIYDRATVENKPSIAQMLADSIDIGLLPFDPDSFVKSSWYATFAVICSVARVSKIPGVIIPVVMAINDQYVPYTVVALQSISENLGDGAVCVVHVFHTDLSQSHVTFLEKGLTFPNLLVFCMNLAGVAELDNAQRRAHYSKEIYFRLWIPELLDVYQKVIYLDSDLVVNKSLVDLYKTDLTRYVIAGVRDFNNMGHRRYVEESLGVVAENYINSGVLIFNTHLCRKQDFRNKCLAISNYMKALSCPDQDMINIVCAGKIKLLDSGWNYLWNYGFEQYRQPPDGPAWFADDFKNAQEKKFIVHFSSAIKPWNYPLYEDAELFWQYARRTSVYLDISRRANKAKVKELLASLRAKMCDLD
jgi:lipopolysaccharide biosynthesis glycosyltransferase